jgi:hypothetical protein
VLQGFWFFIGRAFAADLTKAPDFFHQFDDYSVEQGVPLQSALLDAGEAIIREAAGTGHLTNICS